MDIVFPTCEAHSSTSGVGKTCSINIAYNKQKPLCSSSGSSSWANLGQRPMNHTECRSLDRLCQADDSFTFDLNPDEDVSLLIYVAYIHCSSPFQSFTSLPLSTILPDASSILFSQPSRSSKLTPLIPLRIGDFNNDGFPDVLLTVINATAAPAEGGIFGTSRSTGVQIKLLQNVACKKKDNSDGGMCAAGKYEKGRRKFKVVKGAIADALLQIWDARDAAWSDVDENVSRKSE